PAGGRVVAGRAREDLEVYRRGEPRIEGRVLEQASNLPPDRGKAAGDAPAEDPGRARGRPGEPEKHPDRRRLAGAVWTEVPEQRALRDRQIDRLDGHPLAEALGESRRLDGRVHDPPWRGAYPARRSGRTTPRWVTNALQSPHGG